jgi:formate dehydrogenase maturation protein FdhE
MKLERLIHEPETISLVCHNCESWLKCVISESSFKRNPVKDPFAFLRR